jgi:hypothetical protein
MSICTKKTQMHNFCVCDDNFRGAKHAFTHYAKQLQKMLQYYHGLSSKMDTPRKQYIMTTFLASL